MSEKYVTVQGDMWDNIAYKCYGDETKVCELVSANPMYRDIYVFPAGIELDVPKLETAETAAMTDDVPIWRR